MIFHDLPLLEQSLLRSAGEDALIFMRTPIPPRSRHVVIFHQGFPGLFLFKGSFSPRSNQTSFIHVCFEFSYHGQIPRRKTIESKLGNHMVA